MSEDTLLVGPLAHPAICDALGLSGTKTTISGMLRGGANAGIEAAGWPQLDEGSEPLDAVRVAMTPELRRYAAVMGLSMVAHECGALLGVQPQSGKQSQKERTEWSDCNWFPELAAAIARIVLDETRDHSVDQVADRLPMIGIWANSQIRAASEPVSGGDVVAPRQASDIRIHARRRAYAGYFAIDEWHLSHRTHAGGFTPEVKREGFVSGDAVAILPWDPVRDRVLVIEQFRLAPAMRQDPQPWLLEPVAGRVDAGETVEQAARREALEEADLRLTRLIPAVHHYPSPGALTEFLYQFLAITDLPDGITGVHGLDGETEDIRGHLLERDKLTRMVHSGQITNGPLAMLTLWLDSRAASIRKELALV